MVASNTYGRQVVVPLVNKTGGGVVAGDVVVIASANTDAFTTTTSANSTAIVGVAQETIANNATGRICLAGYVPLVNVNASCTVLHYGATHSVAKQATDVGASRVSGACMVFLSTSATPDAYLYNPDLGGASLTNPMTTAADIIVGGASGVPARLAAGVAGGVLAMGNSVQIWNAGSSFPGSKATNDRYYRTDLGLEFYWDGTRWVTTTLYTVSFPPTDSVTGFSASANVARLVPPYIGVYTLWLDSYDVFYISVGANSGTNYYDILVNWADQADSDTQIGTATDTKLGTTGSNNYALHTAIGAVLSTNARELKLRVTKHASAPNIVYITGTLNYRLITT